MCLDWLNGIMSEEWSKCPGALMTQNILTLESSLWTTVFPTCAQTSLFPTIPCDLEKKLREWGGGQGSVGAGAKAERAEVWV